MEIWKSSDILNHEFSVSSYGRIRNNKTLKIRKLKQDWAGYVKTTLKINGKLRYFSVSRLVLLTFKPISNPSQYQAHHIDFNRLNNHLDNLEWLLPLDNTKIRQPKQESFELYSKLRRKIGENSIKILLESLLEAN